MRIVRLSGGSRAIALQNESEIEVDVSLLDEPQPGQYVIVHAGYALETVESDDAEERIELLGGSEG